MTEKLILERHRQRGKDIINLIVIHGSFLQIPYLKFKRLRRWIKAENYDTAVKEPILAEGTVWIEDNKGIFVGVFNSVDEYIAEMKRFYGQTKIAVKKFYIISR